MIYGSERRRNDLSKIKITLKSDLCPASGDGFSSLIDTDVSYDKYGFPFIGGRRLKGCLREAARYIYSQHDSQHIDEIFGVKGKAQSGSLRISDAQLEDISTLRNEAEVNSELKAEKILSIFSYTRASTAIEDDTAKDSSLRYTRVIKHYSPLTGNELVFYADVYIDEKYEAEFSDICRALRNIGYKRNRGYGAVCCEFIIEKSSESFTPLSSVSGEIRLDYIIKLDANVMISGKKSDETADYIPGTSVLGLLAGEYLKTHEADDRFDEIFMKNNVRFSNLYISDADSHDYFPAPVIAGKIKGDSHLYNILAYDDNKDNDKNIKPLKSGYCDCDLNYITPLTETIYHHRNNDDAKLYTQTSLRPGQYFKGTISGNAEYVSELYELLCKCDICFGKSRSAQYSGCSLVRTDLNEGPTKNVTVGEGELFIVLAVSDILIPDGKGGYDISSDGLKKALGLETLELDKDCRIKRSALKYRTISGYYTQWNMQRPSIRTIAAGSTLVFRAEKNETFSEVRYIGAKQNEGYGKIMFIPFKNLSTVSADNKTGKKKTFTGEGKLSKYLVRTDLIEKMRAKAIDFVNGKEELYKNISKSQIGRFIMFLKYSETYDDLLTLLESGINAEDHRNSNVELFEKLVKASGAEEYSEELWYDYLLLILTLIKYAKRGEKE